MNRDLVFLLAFVISLITLGLLFEASITGAATAYCNEVGCSNFCRFDTDCTTGQACCDIESVGVCGDSCAQAYVLPTNADLNNLPLLESPEPSKPIGLLVSLIFGVFLVGLGYYWGWRTNHR